MRNEGSVETDDVGAAHSVPEHLRICEEFAPGHFAADCPDGGTGNGAACAAPSAAAATPSDAIVVVSLRIRCSALRFSTVMLIRRLTGLNGSVLSSMTAGPRPST